MSCGRRAYREDTGTHGNTIISMMQNDVSANKSNAVRMVTINTDKWTVSSRIYAQNLGQAYSQYDKTGTLNLGN